MRIINDILSSVFNILPMEIRNSVLLLISLFFSIDLSSCKKFLDVETPNSKIPNERVFASDEMANAALAGLYLNMYESGFASGGVSSAAVLTGLSADELRSNLEPDPALVSFETNQLLADNAQVLNLWISIYKSIYQANSIIEGLEVSKGVSSLKKDQLRGEALFVRAFCHFYLVNLFGDVPLVISTDYSINSKVSRIRVDDVYSQVEADLLEAVTLLPENYSGQRIRPVKAVATALLARFYLYKSDWEKAEINSSKIISQANIYRLEDSLKNVFLSNSREVIWQLKPGDRAEYTNEGFTFSAFGSLQNVLCDTLVNSFQVLDKRKVSWITSRGSVYLPYKYKIGAFTGQPTTEYSLVFRLAEQYLIRAEARARSAVSSGPNSAESDVNIIRHRAGLSDTTTNNDIEDALNIISNERKLELFSEWGHRWFDLKRWNKATEILAPMKPEFTIEDVLYPIPQEEMKRNPFLKPQNPGY